MRWLADLTFKKAIKLALVWPAFVLALVTVLLLTLRYVTRDWSMAYDISVDGPGGRWVAGIVLTLLVLAGPSLLFLAAWRLAYYWRLRSTAS